jgi:thermitase
MKTISTMTFWAVLSLSLALTAPVGAQVAPANQGNNADPTLNVETWNGVPVVAGQILVGFVDSVGRNAQKSLTASLPGTRIAEFGSTSLIRLPNGSSLNESMASWAQRPEVAFVEPDVLYASSTVPNDPKWSQQWGTQLVGASAAWDLATGNPNVVVAIIDTGVLTSHTDLNDHYAYGYDTYANDGNPTDTDGHGTHCAGIAAAETNNFTGVAGSAFSCSFAAYRCGNGSFPSSALVSAINKATAAGAHVLSMSWGSSYASPSIKTALQAARDAGCVLVAAAGNDNTTSKSYPAAWNMVLSVASSSPSDGRSSFSNYGTWVDVAAPGQNILSTYKNGGYVKMSGTSMATPLVAGIATLLYSQLGETRSTTNALAVRDALQDTTVPVGSWVTYGRVDFPAALSALDSGSAPVASALAPTSVAVLPEQTITLSGSGFIGTTAVTVDGVPAPSFAVVTDSTLTFEPPLPTTFGTQAVVVHEGTQQSTSLSLTYSPADPPELQVAADISPGAILSLAFAGEAGHQQLLLASLQPTTFWHQGYPLLVNHIIVDVGLLDGAGSLLLDASIPLSLAGVTIQLQSVVIAGSFAGASEISIVTVSL